MADDITIQMLRDACDNHRATELKLQAKLRESEGIILELRRDLAGAVAEVQRLRLRPSESTEWLSGLTREQMRNVA